MVNGVGLELLAIRFGPGGCVRGPAFVHSSSLGGQPLPLLVCGDPRVLDTKPDLQTLIAHVRETNPEYDDERCRERAEKYLQMDPEVFRSTLSGRARANWRSEDLLRKAHSPSLLLQAEPNLGSALYDEDAAEAMELLPVAEYEKWDDSGHGMHSSFPERFVNRVQRFFADVAGTRRTPLA